MSARSSRRVLYAALLGNVLVTFTKFGAAVFTGSAAMLSEAVHSLVDTGNEVLLLYGLRRAAVPADEEHPFGHGRELYFWSFVASIGIGILLALVAAFLARESKGLLIGEPAGRELVADICRIARAHPGVERSNGLFSVHLGPRQIVCAISVDFQDDIPAGEVER